MRALIYIIFSIAIIAYIINELSNHETNRMINLLIVIALILLVYRLIKNRKL